VYIALFAALMAALSLFPPITMPVIGVPITAQSMGAMLAGGVLGAKRGAASMVLFLILVAVGLPLLSGGRGGIGMFAGPTAGFMFGWVAAAWVVGALVERTWPSLTTFKALVICIVGGIGVDYLIGMPWVTAVTGVSFVKVVTGSMAFVPGDIVKAVVAAIVIMAVKRAYPIAGPADGGADAA